MVLPVSKIYFISLKTTLGRRSAFMQYIKEIDLKDRYGREPEWHPANNGQSFPQSINTKGRKTDLHRSEIGCYASHLEVWMKFIEIGLETVLILEDDAVFKPSALSKFLAFDQIPEWDFINFSLNSFSGTKIEKTLVNADLQLYSGFGFWLTHAYCLTNKSAQFLVERMRVQTGGLDWQLAQVQSEMKSFAFLDNPIIQKKPKSLGSTIKHTRI